MIREVIEVYKDDRGETQIRLGLQRSQPSYDPNAECDYIALCQANVARQNVDRALLTSTERRNND